MCGVSRDRGVLLPMTSAAVVYLSRQCSEWSTVASEGSLSLQVSFPASRGRQACSRNRVARQCHGRLTDAIVPDLSSRFMQGERRGGDFTPRATADSSGSTPRRRTCSTRRLSR